MQSLLEVAEQRGDQFRYSPGEAAERGLILPVNAGVGTTSKTEAGAGVRSDFYSPSHSVDVDTGHTSSAASGAEFDSLGSMTPSSPTDMMTPSSTPTFARSSPPPPPATLVLTKDEIADVETMAIRLQVNFTMKLYRLNSYYFCQLTFVDNLICRNWVLELQMRGSMP